MMVICTGDKISSSRPMTRLSMQRVTKTPADRVKAPLWGDRVQEPCPCNYGSSRHSPAQSSGAKTGQVSASFRSGQSPGEQEPGDVAVTSIHWQDASQPCLTLSIAPVPQLGGRVRWEHSGVVGALTGHEIHVRPFAGEEGSMGFPGATVNPAPWRAGGIAGHYNSKERPA